VFYSETVKTACIPSVQTEHLVSISAAGKYHRVLLESLLWSLPAYLYTAFTSLSVAEKNGQVVLFWIYYIMYYIGYYSQRVSLGGRGLMFFWFGFSLGFFLVGWFVGFFLQVW